MLNIALISRLISVFTFLALIFYPGSRAFAQPQALIDSATSARPPRAIVIGFMGGKVSPDDAIRNERIMSDRLKASFPRDVYFQVFENRRFEAAHQKILQFLDAKPGKAASHHAPPETQIVLYGHSWGASAVVTVADELKKDGIPVTLTVQVDSIEKKHQQDALIPANVAHAINFYQPDGLLHGRPEIRAADPASTHILGNFRVNYNDLPTECSLYPWYERKFIKTHIAIECDPVLWKRIEGLIRDTLAVQPTESATLN